MTPIFKSSYSIGRSILTLDKTSTDDGPDSIIEICKENDIKTLVLVEDSMTGFMKAFHACKDAEINLVFGLRITCCNDVKEDCKNSDHKIIIFAKNDDGCKKLNSIVSFAETEGGSKVDFDYLNSVWSNDVDLVIPFYDSFIYRNNMTISNCVPDFTKITPIFFIEDNKLPFDGLLDKLVKSFAGKKYKIRMVKSIYYKNREDYEALMSYKILCNRSFGREALLERPNLDHFGSNEFCMESFLENE